MSLNPIPKSRDDTAALCRVWFNAMPVCAVQWGRGAHAG